MWAGVEGWTLLHRVVEAESGLGGCVQKKLLYWSNRTLFQSKHRPGCKLTPDTCGEGWG